MASRFSLASPAIALILFSLLGCGGDLLLPDPPGGGETVELSKDGGDNQVGTVGEQLGQPLIVKVMTSRGLPATSREVQFVFTDAAGLVTPALAVTNSSGQAFASWVLGPAPGAQTVAAHLVVEGDAEPQDEEFTAEAKPAAPDTVSALSPTSQAGRRGQPVESDSRPKVRVVDRFGNPVPDAAVAWQVIVGEGSASATITHTASDGTSTVDWTLGNRVGIQRLTATVGPITGSPVTFTALVLF